MLSLTGTGTRVHKDSGNAEKSIGVVFISQKRENPQSYFLEGIRLKGKTGKATRLGIKFPGTLGCIVSDAELEWHGATALPSSEEYIGRLSVALYTKAKLLFASPQHQVSVCNMAQVWNGIYS